MENPIQYAVVREDPLVEKKLVERYQLKNALLTASGGCTAFTLATLFPQLKLTLIDSNPAQLQLIQRKAQALQRMGMDPAIFNIGSEDPQGLNAGGSFERLLHCLRDFWCSFILRPEELEHMFDSEKRLRPAVETLKKSRYWTVSFDLFFHDEMLTTLFGAKAVSHAPPSGYPHHFKELIEAAFERADALDNPFLHHLILGHYLNRREVWPLYLQRPPRDFSAETLSGSWTEVQSFAPYDFIQLSNSFDWMEDDEVAAIADRLNRELAPGAVLLWRQMNRARSFEKLFTSFRFETDLSAELLCQERSLFYKVLQVAIKN